MRGISTQPPHTRARAHKVDFGGAPCLIIAKFLSSSEGLKNMPYSNGKCVCIYVLEKKNVYARFCWYKKQVSFNRKCYALCCMLSVFSPRPCDKWKMSRSNAVTKWQVSTNVSRNVSCACHHPSPQRWNLTWPQSSLLPRHLSCGRHRGGASTAWWERPRCRTTVSYVLVCRTLVWCSGVALWQLEKEEGWLIIREYSLSYQDHEWYFNFCGWCKFNHHMIEGGRAGKGVKGAHVRNNFVL